MKLTYHGHACFSLEESGYKLVFDPYKDVPGYGVLHVQGHEVLCSHAHYDHFEVAAVDLLPKAESPFNVTVFNSYHDSDKGEKRGPNKIHLIQAGGLRIAHMGDMGCLPTDVQIKALQNADVMMIPVGGTYTIDPMQAKGVLRVLKPKMIVPMHYRLGGLGFDVLADLHEFTDLFEDVTFLDTNEVEIQKKGKGQVVVPKFLG